MTDPVVTLPPELPGHTLGWDVLWWTTRYIRQPDGPEAGAEWRFTPEQLRFVLHWYGIDAEGRWLYTRGVLRRSKGWGKSPLVAALGLAELCGPVRFEAFAQGGEERPWRDEPYGPGEPIAKPEPAPWVQLAGVSERQTGYTMAMVLAMCAESPITEEYGLDLGLTRIFTAAGGRLEPITASAPTAEGARPTAVYEDETQHYTDSNGGAKLDQVNRRNVGKSPGGTARVLETTNAHAAGEDSVAERSYNAWRAMSDGRARRAGLLYDSREAPEDIDLADEESLMAGLAAAYGDSWWVALERIRDEVWDPSTPPSDSRRFYLNQIAAAVDAWLTEPEWAGAVDATKVIADRDVIVLGFDGSRGRGRGRADATALIGCRVSDGHLFEVGVWEQPLGPAGHGWQAPQAEIEAAVHHAFATWTVVGLYADPTLWDGVIGGWESRYNARLKVRASAAHPMFFISKGFGMKAKALSQVLESFHAAVIARQLTHDGGYHLTAHALNARRRPSASGMKITKEHDDSIRKIDAIVAAVYAWAARLDALAKGLGEPTRKYRAKGF
jgi:hypothetical protein